MTNSEQLQNRILFSKISAIALLFAAIPIFPYVFYQILKFLIFGTACFSGYLYHQEKNKKWMWIMVIIAVIFNPINPLYFGHPIWSVLDIIVSITFFRSPKKHIHSLT